MEEKMASDKPNINTTPQYASFGRRLLAYIVDSGLLSIIIIIVQTMLGQNTFFSSMGDQSVEALQQLQTTTSQSLSALIGISFGLVYYLLFWVNYDGATPGKRLMAIKITKDDGSKVTYPVAFIRYLGTFLSMIPFCLGYLWVIWDKKKQAWHDKIAKTVVIKTNDKPKTFLAMALSFLIILFFSIYMGVGVYHSYKLFAPQLEKGTGSSEVQKSLKSMAKDIPKGNIHWDKAEELFKQLKATDVNDVRRVKQIDAQIVEELKKVLEEQPNNPRVWVELGNAYTWVTRLDSKSAEDGLAAYKKAVELDPNNTIYMEYLADQLMLMGRYDEAVLQLQKSLRLYPGDSGFTHLRLARAYKGLKIYDLSKEHYKEAIKIFTKRNDKGKFDKEILQARKEMAQLPQ